MGKLFPAILFFILCGCAVRWGISPVYSPMGYTPYTETKSVFLESVSFSGNLTESSVDILGFRIKPENFLSKPIERHVDEAIKKEGEYSGLFIFKTRPESAEYLIKAEVKEFNFIIKIEEVPVKGEGYAYYYRVDMGMKLYCEVSKNGRIIISEMYPSELSHATLFHYLGKWEILFTEDLNSLVFRAISQLFDDIERY